jgi:hypothetical protein
LLARVGVFLIALILIALIGVLGLGACEFFGAVALIEPTVIAIATVAIDSPPKIHGRRSLSWFIGRLSCGDSAYAVNMTQC